MLLIGLTTTLALAQNGASTTGTSASSTGTGTTGGVSMSGSSMSGSSMMNGTSMMNGNGSSMSGSSMSGGSMSGGSMNGGSMNGTSMSGGSMNGGSMSGGSMSGSSMSGTSMSGTVSALDTSFVAAAGQGNTFEIEAAKLALKNSTNAKVKAYAQKMITDHTKLGASVKAALAKDKAGLTPPTMVGPAQRVTMNKLLGLKGKAFDAAYKNAMISSHAQTYALFSDYVKKGHLTNLKAVVKQYAPTVKMHWDMAKTLPAT